MVRITISLPADLGLLLRNQARRRGVSLSAGQSLEKIFAEAIAYKTSVAGNRQRPPWAGAECGCRAGWRMD